MKILSVGEVSEHENHKKTKAEERIADLQAEEARLVRLINELRSELEEAKIQNETEIGELNANLLSKKSEVLSEIELLENRKAIALIPVDELMNQATARLKEVEEREAALKQEEDKQNARILEHIGLEEALMSRAEKLNEREKAVFRTEQDAEVRRQKIVDQEGQIKASLDSLSRRWKKFQESLQISEADLARRERDVLSGMRTNEVFKATLDAEAQEHIKARRAIKDGYDTLAQAKKEILGSDK